MLFYALNIKAWWKQHQSLISQLLPMINYFNPIMGCYVNMRHWHCYGILLKKNCMCKWVVGTDFILTHWDWMMYIYIYVCISKIGHHWFRWWLGACLAPSHYLNQCWHFVDWTLENKPQTNLNQNMLIVIKENAIENAVCNMAAILVWSQCAYYSWTYL